MGLPAQGLRRVPQRLPIGAKYVVEGYGGEQGNLRVIARYLVLPGGHRINVPADFSRAASPRTLALLRRSPAKSSPAKGGSRGVGKKFSARPGTGQGAQR
jgi:hypothetical protein